MHHSTVSFIVFRMSASSLFAPAAHIHRSTLYATTACATNTISIFSIVLERSGRFPAEVKLSPVYYCYNNNNYYLSQLSMHVHHYDYMTITLKHYLITRTPIRTNKHSWISLIIYTETLYRRHWPPYVTLCTPQLPTPSKMHQNNFALKL